MGYKPVVRDGDQDSAGDYSSASGGLLVDEAGNAKGGEFQATGDLIVYGKIITKDGMLSGDFSGLSSASTIEELKGAIPELQSDIGTRAVGGGVSAIGGTLLAEGGGGSVEVNADGGNTIHLGAEGGEINVNENLAGNILAETPAGGYVNLNKEDGDTEQANTAGGTVVTNEGGTTPIYINSPQGNAVDCVTNLAKAASGSGNGSSSFPVTPVTITSFINDRNIGVRNTEEIEEPDDGIEEPDEQEKYDVPNWFYGFPRTEYIEDDRDGGVRHTYLEYDDRFSEFVPTYIDLPYGYDDPDRPNTIPTDPDYAKNLILDPEGLGGFIHDPTIDWGEMGVSGPPELNAIWGVTIPPAPHGVIAYKLDCYTTPDFLAEYFKDFDPDCYDEITPLDIQELETVHRVIPKGTFVAKNHENIKWEIMSDQLDFRDITEATFVEIDEDTGFVTGQIPWPEDGVYQEWGVRIGIRDKTTDILLNWKVFRLYRYTVTPSIPDAVSISTASTASTRGMKQDYSKVTGTFDNPLGPGAILTSKYGMRKGKKHSGTDYDLAGSSTKLPLGAADGGVVTDVSWWGGGGKTVLIDHGTHTSAMMHMSSTGVKVGDVVEKGQIVGVMGNTGANSQGAHLHIEIVKKSDPNAIGDKSNHLTNRKNGNAIDPHGVLGTGTVPHDHDHEHDHEHPNVPSTPCPPAGSADARIAEIKANATPKQLAVIERMEAEMDKAGKSSYDKSYLLDLAQIESRFIPNANAKENGLDSSAKGLYQFVDDTAAEVGITDVYDIEDNTRGGMVYVEKADAAYEYFKSSDGAGIGRGAPISRETAALYNTYTKNEFKYAFHHNGPGNLQRGRIPFYNGKKMDGAAIWRKKKGT